MVRKLPLLFFFSLLFYNSFAYGNNFISIKGRFSGFQIEKHKQFLSCTVSEIVESLAKQILINKDGEFEFTLALRSTSQIFIKYQDRSLTLFVNPNDELFISIDIVSFLEDDQGYLKYVNLSGKYFESNNAILKHANFLRSLDFSRSNFDYSTLLAFKKSRLEIRNIQLQSLSKFISDNNITDAFFIKYAKSEIEFKCGQDLCGYPVTGTVKSELSDTSSYFDFTRIIKLSDPEISFASSYIKYIKAYSSAIEILVNVGANYKSQLDQARARNSVNARLEVAFGILRKKTDGIGQQIIISSLLGHHIKNSIPPDIMDSIKRLLPSELLNAVYSVKSGKTLADAIIQFTALTKKSERVKDIFSGRSGKVVYVVFWTAKCRPCLTEMPYYDQLNIYLKDSVDFLFLASDMSNAEWKEVISKHNIKGTHYLITSDELAFFETHFNLKWISTSLNYY